MAESPHDASRGATEPVPSAPPAPASLDYQSRKADSELHTESAGEVLRAMAIVFLILFLLFFLVCGGFAGLLRGLGGF